MLGIGHQKRSQSKKAIVLRYIKAHEGKKKFKSFNEKSRENVWTKLKDTHYIRPQREKKRVVFIPTLIYIYAYELNHCKDWKTEKKKRSS